MKDEGKSNGNDVIIADCNGGLLKILRVRIQHYYKETNKCVDALARRGASLSQDFVIFHCPPADLALLFGLDAVGTMYEQFHSVVAVSQFISVSLFTKKKKIRLLDKPFSP